MTLLRKKKLPEPEYDPVSAETWAAAAKATAVILEIVEHVKTTRGRGVYWTSLQADLDNATRLTPCATDQAARTSPRKDWGFGDFYVAGCTLTALSNIVKDAEPVVSEELHQKAVDAVTLMHAELAKYSKIVGRERSMERLSGELGRRR